MARMNEDGENCGNDILHRVATERLLCVAAFSSSLGNVAGRPRCYVIYWTFPNTHFATLIPSLFVWICPSHLYQASRLHFLQDGQNISVCASYVKLIRY